MNSNQNSDSDTLSLSLIRNIWDKWNKSGGPKYPCEKVVQFVFRNYPTPDKRKGIRTLDLGCGSGVHTLFLAYEGFIVTGVDFSEIGINNTREKLHDLGLNATLILGSVDNLGFSDNSFDLVICVGVYECTGFEIASRSIKNVSKILCKGGKGLFIFASAQDFRVRGGENTLRLFGYTRQEVDKIFNNNNYFSTVFVDMYITTLIPQIFSHA